MTNPVAPAGTIAPTGRLLLRWWFIAVPLLIVMVIASVDKLAISVVISNKQFLQELDLVGRPAFTGMLMSGFLFSYSVSVFFWGFFVRRFGPRVCAIVGIVIWGATMILSGIAHSAGALIGARILLGVGEGFTFPVSSAFVANWFPVKDRARATSFYVGGTTLGPAVSGVLTVAVIAAGGWRSVFFTLAALSILIALPIVLFLMRDKPRQHPRVSSDEVRLIEEGSLAKTKEIPKVQGKEGYLTNYRFWLLTMVHGFNAIFYWGWATWMPTYFQVSRHFSFKSAGYVYSLTFLFAVISLAIVSHFSDRVLRRAPFAAITYTVASIVFFVGGVVVGNAYWALVLLSIAIILQQPAFGMLETLWQSIVPERFMGSAVGLGKGLSNLISAASPALIGFFVGVWGFGIGILALAVASLLCGILTFILARQGY